MCQVRLTIVLDHPSNFNIVCMLGMRKRWDVPSTIINLFSPYLPISTCLQPWNKKVVNMPNTIKNRSWPSFQFQHVYKLRIKKWWDVPSTINNRSWTSFQYQHVYRLGVRKRCDVPREINNRFSPYLPIWVCLPARNKKVVRCAKYD